MHTNSKSLPVDKEMGRIRKEYREKAKNFEYVSRKYIKIYYPNDYTDILRAVKEGLVHWQKIRGGRSRGEKLYYCKREINHYLKIRDSLKTTLTELSKAEKARKTSKKE